MRKIWQFADEVTFRDFCRPTSGLDSINPIETSVKGRYDGWFDIASEIGWFCGVGLVNGTAFGSRISIGYWNEFWSISRLTEANTPKIWRRNAEILNRRWFYDDIYNELWLIARNARLRRLKVFHAASNAFPDLRDWEAPSPPEVTLILNHPSYRVGGILLDNPPSLPP